MNCTLLSVAGAGSTFLWKNYEMFSNQHLQHNHMITKVDSGCAVISIRDPAERLESGFLYEFMYPKHGRTRLTRFNNASYFADALFNNSNVNHKKATYLLHASIHKRAPGDDGSFFLYPQSQYFVNNANKTMHVFCTKCLTQQWSIFSHNATTNAMHMQRKKTAKPRYAAKSKLTDKQSTLIRQLFPQDMILLHKYCSYC